MPLLTVVVLSAMLSVCSSGVFVAVPFVFMSNHLFVCQPAFTAAAPQVPKVWAMVATAGVGAVAILPVMVVLQQGSPVGLWLLSPLMVGLCGVLSGLMTTIGPQIYPPAVRTTGYNLGHAL
jgi:hypothetical protein